MFMTNLLRNAFPHLQLPQIETFVRGLFELSVSEETFSSHLKDFLITLREFSGDNQELFMEDLELEQERKRQAEREAALKVPGMLKPSEKPDDLSD